MIDIGPYSNYRLTVRLELANKPGMFAKVAAVLAEEGANLGAVDIVSATADRMVPRCDHRRPERSAWREGARPDQGAAGCEGALGLRPDFPSASRRKDSRAKQVSHHDK